MVNGALLNDMRIVASQLVVSAGFETDITVVDRESLSAVVKGVATLHNSSFDPQTGVSVNARQAHCLFATDALVLAGLSVFSDVKKLTKANLKGYTVSFADAHNKTWTFAITEARPSETFGLITVFLGDKA